MSISSLRKKLQSEAKAVEQTVSKAAQTASGDVAKLARNSAKNVSAAARVAGKDAGTAAQGIAKGAQSWLPQPKNLLKSVEDGFVNVAGAAVGYAEMVGLRYPVKAYSSPVTDGLTRGSRLDAEGMAQLKAQGFRSVVDLRAESNSDQALAQQFGMGDLHLPIIDNTPPTDKQMKSFLDFVTDPKNAPAYVHCEAGQGRTGVAVACYRMAVQGWPVDQALAEAVKFGDKVPDQQDFIKAFGAKLAAGKIKGYPLTGAARDRALHPPNPSPGSLSSQLDQVTHSKLTPGNAVQVYVDGEHAFPAILKGLDSAQKSINYETYNFLPNDAVASTVADHLIAAKQRGVDVHVVLDAVGSREILFHHNATVQRLEAAGVKVQLFDKLDGLDDANIHRDHRKLIVIDGKQAFVGGMNTGVKYMGGPSVAGRKHDVFASITGPGVRDVNADFVSSWKAAGGKPLPASIANPPAVRPQPNGVPMRVVEHTPGQDLNIEAAYLTMINDAKKNVNVENSFPLTPEVASALSAAARRGVQVRYIVGSHEGMLGLVARQSYQGLLDAGVQIYLYPTPIHTKSLSVDGQVASFGSSNVDAVSLSRNREVISIVEDPAFTRSYDQALFDKDVIGDPQGQKTLALPRQLKPSLWQKIEGAVVSGLWPASFK